MDKIAIFCSASDEIDPVYFEKARELGVWMGQNKKTLIYGGANVGLMECVARAAKENGCPTVLGVVPTKLEQRGRVSDVLDVTFRTDNLSDRKEVMLNEADVLVALPGGVGTLDEVFSQNFISMPSINLPTEPNVTGLSIWSQDTVAKLSVKP